jgi:hypothetical protein
MSKQVAHTPGQWHAVGTWVEIEDDRVPDICSCDPRTIDQEGRSDAEMAANARLIAAAPDLLKALQELEQAYCRAGEPLTRAERNEDRKRLIAARQAIAKATYGALLGAPVEDA